MPHPYLRTPEGNHAPWLYGVRGEYQREREARAWVDREIEAFARAHRRFPWVRVMILAFAAAIALFLSIR